MNFDYTGDQEELRQLTRKILDDQVTMDRLREVEAGEEWLDRRTWDEFAKAGLLGIALPEDLGGGGLGFLEIAIVLEEVGRAVAPVPVLASIVTGALPIAEFGTAEQRKQWVPSAAGGETFLTAALQELNNDDAGAPTTAAGSDGSLSGEKHFVPAAHLAARVLVPARSGDGIGVYLVDPQGDGATLERVTATNGEPLCILTLDGAPGELLGDGSTPGAEIVEWTRQRAVAGICMVQSGLSERALRLTAEYVSSREQFDHPIAAFQAVSQRAADAYIDTEAVRLTAHQAAWRLAEGLPAEDEIAIAKFWAADGGQRVGHAAQHLHGGVGVDTDYPLHRYFTWSKQHELTLGSGTRQLLGLGAALAAD